MYQYLNILTLFYQYQIKKIQYQSDPRKNKDSKTYVYAKTKLRKMIKYAKNATHTSNKKQSTLCSVKKKNS